MRSKEEDPMMYAPVEEEEFQCAPCRATEMGMEMEKVKEKEKVTQVGRRMVMGTQHGDTWGKGPPAAPPPQGRYRQQGDSGEGTTGGQPPLCEDVAPAWGHPQVPAGCPQMPPGCPQEQLLSLKDKTTSFCALCQSCLSNGDAGVREQVTARGQRARWHLGGPVPTLSPLSPLSPRPSWC